MRTNTTPAALATTTALIQTATARLAIQLERSPEELAAAIMLAGIAAIDEELGIGGEIEHTPLFFVGHSLEPIDRSRTITGIIAGMTAPELEKVSSEAQALEISPQQFISEESRFDSIRQADLQ